MCVICAHLTQRILTLRFFAGVLTGIVFTIIFYHQKESIDKPKFRPDQSKFEYEKNQLPSEQIDRSESSSSSSIWNSSWDGLKKMSTYPRHLYLIRHGQYFDNAGSLNEMKLTILGKEQLKYTGMRLNQMNIQFNRLIHSGMVRAFESATIINEQLDTKLQLIKDANLTEGLPVAPIPYAGISQRDADAYGDRARIDTAFATYFHRAHNDQRKETHDIIVFHANILRYFICKIMQFPIQAWLRITLNHGSITQITILSDGSIVMKSVGDSGFIPSNKVTF
ncbi:unnamed protein product [Adineta steineri]|uniref:Serine/threonine-protein phosphatase PGAM5, mitochondrial n=1 Tax=Adineta steineri TaxID=433720 RepID=A0A813QAR8_9BILA|nr:unnamed protein product [Adineta steineri]CAF3791373.1 unnamed protein product [Adineta steineri]